jgi:hypothetical protein
MVIGAAANSATALTVNNNRRIAVSPIKKPPSTLNAACGAWFRRLRFRLIKRQPLEKLKELLPGLGNLEYPGYIAAERGGRATGRRRKAR